MKKTNVAAILVLLSGFLGAPGASANPRDGMQYKYSVTPTGLIRKSCAQGRSHLTLDPESEDMGEDFDAGAYRLISLRIKICSIVGYKKVKKVFLLPEEVLSREFTEMVAVGGDRVFTGVPSTVDPSVRLALVIHRLDGDTFRMTWHIDSPDGEVVEYPVDIEVGTDDELLNKTGWKQGFLPWKKLVLRTPHPIFSDPIEIHASLESVEPRDDDDSSSAAPQSSTGSRSVMR